MFFKYFGLFDETDYDEIHCRNQSVTQIFKWSWNFLYPSLGVDGSHFFVFLQLFLVALAGRNNITGFSHFGLLFANRMLSPCLCGVSGSYWLCTNLKQISRLMKPIFSAFPSARSPAPLSLLWGLGGSRRLNHRISVVPQRFIAKLVMHCPPVIIYETALYCATQRPPH